MNFFVAVTIPRMVAAPMLSCIAPCDCTILMYMSFTLASVVKSGCSTVKANTPQCSCNRLSYLAHSSRVAGCCSSGQ